MKTINSNEITEAIKKTIIEAEEYLIIVSPYVNFKEWEDLKQLILSTINRKIQVIFYTRMDHDNFKSWEQVEQLGLKPKLIKNLHAKLYFNENAGVVTSMNLLSSSSKNAIEFGLLLDQTNEIDELKKFCKSQLEPFIESIKPNENDLYLAKETFINILSNHLSNIFQKRVYVKANFDQLKFNINNEFYMYLEKSNNQLFISGRVSELEKINFNLLNSKFNYKNCQLSANNGAITVHYTKSFSSSNYNYLKTYEKQEILNVTAYFADELLNFKENLYCNTKSKP